MKWSTGPNHLTDEALARLVDTSNDLSSLPGESRAHLSSCPECQELHEAHSRARMLLIKVNPGAAVAVPVGSWSNSRAESRTLGLAMAFATGILVLAIVGFRSITSTGASAGASPGAAGSASTPTVAATAKSSSTSSPIPTNGLWRAIASADAAGASWSPDSRYVLVWQQPTSGDVGQSRLSLFDASGNLIRTIHGTSATPFDPRWFNATEFLVRGTSNTSIGRVASPDLTSTNLPVFNGSVFASGDGAVAYETGSSLDQSSQYVVWTEAGSSRPQAGVPVAWSNDGTRLAVWHWQSGASGPDASGWIEAVTWPGLRSLGSIHQNPGGPDAFFDPTGRYLVAAGHVLDTTEGQTVSLAIPGAVAWGPGNNLAVPDIGDDLLQLVDPFTHAARNISHVGDAASASADGSRIVAWYGSQDLAVTTIWETGQVSIPVPGGVQPPNPLLSPDGSHLLVIVAGSGSTANKDDALLTEP
jgi:hypothetical protein